jgi:molybdenum cofactor biosynthesis enzyme MoaA
MARARQDAQEADVYRVFDQLKALSYNDVTFTGGEPLLKWPQILRYLDYLQQIEYWPDIKFVSNGLALRPEFTAALQDYPGRIRFNISMHSLDPVLHDRIVRQLSDRPSRTPSGLSRIQDNLAVLRTTGIPFKLNFVLLKGLNTAPSDLEQILSYALQVGAARVKFLELLITQKLKALYPYYYRLDAVRDMLGAQLTQTDCGLRRTVYRWRDTPLEVELQRCTCRDGCNLCALNRDVNITAELRYFPCFLNPDDGADLRTTPLSGAITAGAARIAGMAQRYGDHSPIIIRDHYLTKHESFYYVEIALDDVPAVLASLSATQILELERYRCLTEVYFGDGSSAFASFEYVHKLARNSYDHHAMAILQQHRVDPNGSGRIDTTFERDGEDVASIEAYIEAMAGNGFAVILRADWTLDYYRTRSAEGTDMTVSIGSIPERASALLRSTQPLPALPCPLRPLRHPVPAWLAETPH